MLADELMQFARRQWWDARAGWPPAPFDVACQATRVLCRLAALHEDADYRQGAIVADADYRTDAARALSSLEPAITAAAGTAIYALAVTELNALG